MSNRVQIHEDYVRPRPGKTHATAVWPEDYITVAKAGEWGTIQMFHFGKTEITRVAGVGVILLMDSGITIEADPSDVFEDMAQDG